MPNGKTEGPSRAQKLVLAVLEKPRPYPPTIREIAAEIGCTPSNIHAHLTALRKKGMVEWEERKPRTLRVAGK